VSEQQQLLLPINYLNAGYASNILLGGGLTSSDQ
jgi:hypothetical protein